MPVKSGTESKSDRPFPPLVAYFWGCRCYCYCCYCCLFSLFSTSIYRLSQPYRRTEKCPLLKWRRDMSVMSAIRFSRSLSSTRQPTDDGDFYSTFSFIRDLMSSSFVVDSWNSVVCSFLFWPTNFLFWAWRQRRAFQSRTSSKQMKGESASRWVLERRRRRAKDVGLE